MQISRPIFKKLEKCLRDLIAVEEQDQPEIPTDLSRGYDRWRLDGKRPPPNSAEFFFKEMERKQLVVRHPAGGWMRYTSNYRLPPSAEDLQREQDECDEVRHKENGDMPFTARFDAPHWRSNKSLINKTFWALDMCGARIQAVKYATDENCMILSITPGASSAVQTAAS